MPKLRSYKVLAFIFIAFAFSASVALERPAFADKPAHAGGGKPAHAKGKKAKHGGGKSRYESKRGGDGGAEVRVIFGDRDRQTIRRHYAEGYASRNCPPGLAKKRNGCLPPGQAKKYRRGDVVPDDVVLIRVPDDLVVKLPRLPTGYVYRRVEGEILVIAEAARKVIDIAVILSTL